MLFFVPDATFTQQFIMYSFFIGIPILLIILIVVVGIKSVKQNKNSNKCPHCFEFLDTNQEFCNKCEKDLGEIIENK